MTKHIDKTQQTKEKLISAFWELYCENKIEKITVKAVTDKAGYYRSTFYEYFSDMYGVLEEIENSLLQKHRTTMEQVLQAKDISLIKALAFSFCEENAAYLAVLLGPNGNPKFVSTVKAHIAKCIRELLHVDSSRKEIQLTLEMVSGSIISVLLYWYQHQDTMDLQEVFDVVLKFARGGAFSLLDELDIPLPLLG